MNALESKHNEQCCSCWADCEIDDHLLQCPKQAQYQNEIYQVIRHLGKEMDPVLQNILLNGTTKYLKGIRQTKYIVSSSSKQQTDYWNHICQVRREQERTTKGEDDNYWQLQRNQEAIRWDNPLRGKFVKDWRKLNG